MGVMNAIRFDNNFSSLFNRLTSKGKHTTTAQDCPYEKNDNYCSFSL